jgi:hypothetical protein
VKETKYYLISGKLYNLAIDGILQHCILEHERNMLFLEAHEWVAGGHYTGKEISQKILHAGLWCPTLHKHDKLFYQCFIVYCRLGKPSSRDKIPLVPQVKLQDFDKWEVHFVGPINSLSRRSRAR